MEGKRDEKKSVSGTTEGYYSDSSHVSSSLRRQSVASDGSLYDDEKGRLALAGLESALPPPPPYEAVRSNSISPQEFGFYYSNNLRRGLCIAKTEPKSRQIKGEKALKTPFYYAEMSEFSRGKPDVTLHGMPAGTDIAPTLDLSTVPRDGPVLAIARIPVLSRHVHIGLGNPADYVASSSTQSGYAAKAGEPNLNWVELRNPNKLSYKEYMFRYQTPGSAEMKEYMWRRTHDASHGVEGSTIVRAMMLENYILVDVASGENLAVFLENRLKSWNKRGKLRVLKEIDGGLGLVVVLSCVGLLEKFRRSGGGGGGGG